MSRKRERSVLGVMATTGGLGVANVGLAVGALAGPVGVAVAAGVVGAGALATVAAKKRNKARHGVSKAKPVPGTGRGSVARNVGKSSPSARRGSVQRSGPRKSSAVGPRAARGSGPVVAQSKKRGLGKPLAATAKRASGSRQQPVKGGSPTRRPLQSRATALGVRATKSRTGARGSPWARTMQGVRRVRKRLGWLSRLGKTVAASPMWGRWRSVRRRDATPAKPIAMPTTMTPAKKTTASIKGNGAVRSAPQNSIKPTIGHYDDTLGAGLMTEGIHLGSGINHRFGPVIDAIEQYMAGWDPGTDNPGREGLALLEGTSAVYTALARAQAIQRSRVEDMFATEHGLIQTMESLSGSTASHAAYVDDAARAYVGRNLEKMEHMNGPSDHWDQSRNRI